MTKKIALSPKTVALLNKLKKINSQADKIAQIFKLDNSNIADLDDLALWLKQNDELVLSETDQLDDDDDPQLLLASFNANLMKDLAKSLPGYIKPPKTKTKTSLANRVKYGLLIFAGTVFFGCEGFDGITAIVGILSMSTTGLFIIGTIFAFISVMAFYAFNLTEIARNLEIERKEARELVDRYLKEVEEINAIRKHLNNNYLRRKSIEEREEDLLITELLIARYKTLDEGRQALTRLSENRKLRVAKYGVGLVIGIIYFSSGFFAGQAVATALAGLLVASSVPIFWPVFAASLVVGIAAFSVYWFVERPSIDKLVGRWFGLDQEKIECLCDSESIENDKTRLENLKENLILSKSKLIQSYSDKSTYEFRLREANKRIKELRTLLARRQSLQLIQETQGDLQSLGFFFEAGQACEAPVGKLLELSQKTMDLIDTLREHDAYSDKVNEIFSTGGADTLKLQKLIKWLTLSQAANETLEDDSDTALLLASLNAALLKDLSKLLPDTKKKEKQANKSSNKSGMIYTFLALAGTIYFGCEGFDGITAIISMFSVPKLAVFAVGTFFAAISIMAFYAFDLTEISRNLGIKKKNVNQLVDVYLKEVSAINAIRRNLDNEYIKRTSVAELEEDLLITELLIERYKKLDEGRASLDALMSSKKLTGLKYLVAGVIGIIYFSGGFFTGQAVVVAIAGLFVASTASLFWPIFVASFAIGLAALSVYWFVERPGIDKLVGRLCGLDQEKIESFCNLEKIAEHSTKLDNLRANIIACKDSMVAVSEENVEYATKLREANETIRELALQMARGRSEEQDQKETRRRSASAPAQLPKSLTLEHAIDTDSDYEFALNRTDGFFDTRQTAAKSFSESDYYLSHSH
ncbi:hypothetical protein BN59_00214 [Legionella massiliensis]|uniref:Coiled-coil protein n=1 Tax=Legionella massiliensis TaxID=1034943 RepID=A0A078KSM3_9GAMM|nr:hypothetical protein [Legionella massiliensis]CDZ75952.1 hypothetical protein BN59_00214 [Legionella massiliensis]CEE11690.1 hypothetical protein BN1094_00214 [Legionella massiliensis]